MKDFRNLAYKKAKKDDGNKSHPSLVITNHIHLFLIKG